MADETCIVSLADSIEERDAEIRRLKDVIRIGGATLRAERAALGVPGGIDEDDVSLMRAERDRLRTELGRIAHAAGVCHEADGHACEPGPVEAIVRAIKEGASARTELERWKTAFRTREEKCETCEGDGFMDAVVGIDNDGSERFEAEPCGECGGTGRGGVAFLIAETRAQADAELAALHQAHAALTDECARLRTAHPDDPVASAKTSDGSVDQQAVTGGDLSDALRRKLAQEIADFVIYADLWAASQGIDLEQAIIETFNKKSNELGSDKRLP